MLLFVYRQRLLQAEARLTETWCRLHLEERPAPDHWLSDRWQSELASLAFHCRQAFTQLHTAETRALNAAFHRPLTDCP